METSSERHATRLTLLLEIARCPVASACLSDRAKSRACSEVVASQAAPTAETFQVPEPWSGPLGTAPVLFVSSNPSISTVEMYPTGDRDEWPDERIVDFFEGRFGGGREVWTRNGVHNRRKDDSFSTGKEWGRFWAAAKHRASEALGRAAIPGEDYAMTEVVRCKSRQELGVASARPCCAERYLGRMLAVAAARLIVCFGVHAADDLRRRYGLPSGRPFVGPISIEGLTRYVVFLPHPNARTPKNGRLKKRIDEVLTPVELADLRAFLKSAAVA
jgi:hypothetical protein